MGLLVGTTIIQILCHVHVFARKPQRSSNGFLNHESATGTNQDQSTHFVYSSSSSCTCLAPLEPEAGTAAVGPVNVAVDPVASGEETSATFFLGSIPIFASRTQNTSNQPDASREKAGRGNVHRSILPGGGTPLPPAPTCAGAPPAKCDAARGVLSRASSLSPSSSLVEGSEEADEAEEEG